MVFKVASDAGALSYTLRWQCGWEVSGQTLPVVHPWFEFRHQPLDGLVSWLSYSTVLVFTMLCKILPAPKIAMKANYVFFS